MPYIVFMRENNKNKKTVIPCDCVEALLICWAGGGSEAEPRLGGGGVTLETKSAAKLGLAAT